VTKNNQDNQIQSVTLGNRQYVFFEEGIRSVQSGLGQSPRSCGNFREFFVLQVTLHSARLLLTVSYRKTLGSRMY